MKTIALMLMVAIMASGIYADNQVVERKYHRKSFKNAHLGIVSVSVKGTYKLRFLASRDLQEQQAMVYKRVIQGLPRAFEEASTCSRTEACTTAVLDSVSLRTLSLDHGEKIQLNLPVRMHFQGAKETWPSHCLFMEITEVYDDSSTKYVDVAAGGMSMAGGGVGIVIPIPTLIFKNKETADECLHYSCNYAFVDCASGALVCYGRISAEGCGRPADRYGSTGVWTVSLRELAKQITEESPYEMKELDASDFH